MLRGGMTSLIYTWRRKVCEARGEPAPAASLEPGFAEAVVSESEEVARPATCPAIVIDLAGGRRVSILASTPTGLVTAALKALR
jgi:transposase